jgi:hypothetical protein
MTEKLKQIIKEEMVKLPKEAQEAINAFDWEKISEEIGQKYLLNEAEINDFQVETFLVLIGLEYPDSYANNIENEVGTSAEEAEKIADEAEEKIFTPIYNTLEENIKKSSQGKNHWQQNLDFVLSGGDYSAFLVPTKIGIPTEVGKRKDDASNIETKKTIIPVFSIKEENLKGKI